MPLHLSFTLTGANGNTRAYSPPFTWSEIMPRGRASIEARAAIIAKRSNERQRRGVAVNLQMRNGDSDWESLPAIDFRNGEVNSGAKAALLPELPMNAQYRLELADTVNRSQWALGDSVQVYLSL